MSTNTLVSWNLPINPSTQTEVDAEANARLAQQTQEWQLVEPAPHGPETSTARRFWVDQASAESWISFVQQYSPLEAIIET
jgi:hypothetical protein